MGRETATQPQLCTPHPKSEHGRRRDLLTRRRPLHARRRVSLFLLPARSLAFAHNAIGGHRGLLTLRLWKQTCGRMKNKQTNTSVFVSFFWQSTVQSLTLSNVAQTEKKHRCLVDTGLASQHWTAVNFPEWLRRFLHQGLEPTGKTLGCPQLGVRRSYLFLSGGFLRALGRGYRQSGCPRIDSFYCGGMVFGEVADRVH